MDKLAVSLALFLFFYVGSSCAFRVKFPLGWLQGTISLSCDSSTRNDTEFSAHLEEKAEFSSWAAVKEMEEFESVVTRNHRLEGYSLEKFWDHFLRDGTAPLSLEKFLKTQGDTDIVTSEWRNVGSRTKQRDILYNHPVNVPMAPPIASARKEQTAHFFPGNGIHVETRTFISGVPMSGSFYIVERMAVEQVDNHAVSVTLQFELRFTNSSFYKQFITRNAMEDCTKLLDSYTRYMAGVSRQRNFENILLETAPESPWKEMYLVK